jgi:hypothetical protein
LLRHFKLIVLEQLRQPKRLYSPHSRKAKP